MLLVNLSILPHPGCKWAIFGWRIRKFSQLNPGPYTLQGSEKHFAQGIITLQSSGLDREFSK